MAPGTQSSGQEVAGDGQGEVTQAEITIRAGAAFGFLSLLLWHFYRQQRLLLRRRSEQGDKEKACFCGHCVRSTHSMTEERCWHVPKGAGLSWCVAAAGTKDVPCVL